MYTFAKAIRAILWFDEGNCDPGIIYLRWLR